MAGFLARVRPKELELIEDPRAARGKRWPLHGVVNTVPDALARAN